VLKFIGFAAALLVLITSALIFVLQSPQDLSVISLQVIRWNGIPAIDEPYNPAEPHKLLVVVRFRTSTNLAKFGHNFWYKGLYVHASLCQTDKRISEGFNLVYDQSGRLGFGERSSQNSTKSEYHLYLALQSSNIPTFANLPSSSR
jgi:hypothetical protein